MKHFITMLCLLLFAAFGMSQERKFISTCGKTQTAIKWSEEHKNGKIQLNTAQGSERHEYLIGNGYKTESWRIVNPSTNTYLTVSLNRGTYTLSGRFKGKPISKTVKSKGKPWYQNIAYNAGLTLKNGKAVEYECFRPDNMKLYTMSATKKRIVKFDGKNALKIEVALTGFMSVFWSCDYYFDPHTLLFVGYKGVNGGPGTPETKISVSR